METRLGRVVIKMATVAEQFDAAVKVVQCMPKDGPFQPSYEMKKRFYGLFKQATKGPCNEPKPAFWEAIKRTKWEAWKQLGDMSQEEAMNSYVADLLKAMKKGQNSDTADRQNIVETMPINEEVRDFLQAMGPFFESVNEPLPVPEEEKWRFQDATKTKGASLPENRPLNGNMHSAGTPNGGSLASPALTNHSDRADGVVNAVMITPTLDKIGPNGDAFHDHSHPFVSDVSGNFAPDSPRDLSSIPGGDRSSGTSADVTVSSDTETESEEDFCDSTDQPDQLPELVKAPAVNNEALRPIREEEVLMTSTPQVKKVLAQVEVHRVNGGHPVENGHSQSDDAEAVRNGDTPVARRRGGGEVVPGARGQGSRGQGSVSGDQRGPMGPGRGQGQDNPGRDRAPYGGQGGAPGGREPGNGGRARAPPVDVSEQIAIALQRLQCDMSSVLARLNTLEALALSQAQQSQAERQSPGADRQGQGEARSSRTVASSRSWLTWIFPRNLPGRTVFFLLIWPLIVNVALALWRRRRQRHLRR